MDSILSLFFMDTTRWFHIREAAEKARVSPMTARKYLELYEKQGLLLSRRSKLYKEYKANLESQLFRMQAGTYMAQRLVANGLVDYISRELGYPVIFLFGSAAKGEMGPKSDIDLFVLGEEKKKLDLSRFEKELERPIQIFLYNKKEWGELKKKDPGLADNIINGIKLARQLEVFR